MPGLVRDPVRLMCCWAQSAFMAARASCERHDRGQQLVCKLCYRESNQAAIPAEAVSICDCSLQQYSVNIESGTDHPAFLVAVHVGWSRAAKVTFSEGHCLCLTSAAGCSSIASASMKFGRQLRLAVKLTYSK